MKAPPSESLSPEEREAWQLKLLQDHMIDKVLFEYELASGPLRSHRALCCGWFKDEPSFQRFKQVEATYNRFVLWSRIVPI